MDEDISGAVATLEELRERKLTEIKGNEGHIISLQDDIKMLEGQIRAFDEALEQLRKFGKETSAPETPALIGKYASMTLSAAILDIVEKGDNRSGLFVPEIVTKLRSEGFKSKAKDLYQSTYAVAMNLIKQEKIKEGKKDGKRTFMRKQPF